MNKRVKLDLLPQILKIFGRNEPAIKYLFSFWGLSREELLHISTISTEFRDLTIRNNFFWYVLAKHYHLISDPYNFHIEYKNIAMPNMPKIPLLGVVYACGDFNNQIVEIPTIIPNLRNVTMVSASEYHSLFLTQDGMAHACGNGEYGRLGDGIIDNHNVGTPIVIPNLQDVIMISAGVFHSLFLTQNGMVHACGSGYNGVLGDGITYEHDVGVPTIIYNLQNVIMISAGQYHSLFLTQDGTAHACGSGKYGRLGDGIIVSHVVGTPTVIPNLQDVIMISAGHSHSLFLTQDGTAHACGYGMFDQLGNGGIIGIPTIIPNLRNVTMISAGYHYSLFLTKDGRVHVCGTGEYGIIDYHIVEIPKVIPNLQNVNMIATSSYHSLFLTQNRKVYARGNGLYGRLGDGITVYHTVRIPTMIPNLQNITMVSTGRNYSLFLTEN